ncbi:MAG: tRNA uridine-5-carboxymethylaminomethyl(34) synthesis GTPase MnmE [Omnitrophica bacterium RIFCSPHIGHO2_02_FULL_63_14]|nr:MAG: tRNA uridine-5-carboxymethylaminomethyl(34) synthesis GTPase MnmE [Omnitrophica bacterium RIFCSPHIGHO2_02_FULL_63_14]
MDSDTIAAVSTPRGEGGIGIVRLSGPRAVAIADAVFRSRKGTPVSRQKSFTVQYGRVEGVDEVLTLLMRAPKSYTCEDMVEISAHGGPRILDRILALAFANGARPAERGEFTKRAFLNGRIDLLQAEAVLDLVQAKTTAGAKTALGQLEGRFSAKARELKKILIDVLSHLEASIDFPDDFPDTDPAEATAAKLDRAAAEIRTLLKDADAGILAKSGFRLVLAGRPNVGKSSLMNRLCRADRVIVTPEAGTTRDVVEEQVDLRGYPVRVFDTAGLGRTEQAVEKEGMERARRAAVEADLVVVVVDASQPFGVEDDRLLESLGGRKILIAANKCDLPVRIDVGATRRVAPTVLCSCLTGDGLLELEDKIFSMLITVPEGFEPSGTAMVNTVRQKDLLGSLLASVESAASACRTGLSPELIAVDVRQGLEHLGELVGEVIDEEVLEALFNQFCIGK